MPTEKINLVGRFHYHIDNGGVNIQVNAEVQKDYGEKESIIIPEIVFSTSYFGYAHLESKLVGLELSPKLIHEMGLFFIDAAAELQKLHDRLNG